MIRRPRQRAIGRPKLRLTLDSFLLSSEAGRPAFHSFVAPYRNVNRADCCACRHQADCGLPADGCDLNRRTQAGRPPRPYYNLRRSNDNVQPHDVNDD